MTRAGIDVHKKSCTTCVFADNDVLASSPSETFVFRTTPQGVNEFMEKVPKGSTVVIESSTTGKAISRRLSGRYEVHMIAPSERKPAVKTDKRGRGADHQGGHARIREKVLRPDPNGSRSCVS